MRPRLTPDDEQETEVLDATQTRAEKPRELPPEPGQRRTEQALHDIVIVGGGVAGLELATRLGETLGRRGKARITLIEKRRTHLWKPLLHSLAAGSIDPSQHELDYLAQAHWRHFRYRFGELIGLDREKQEVK